jgi:hypothetical protein
MRTLIITTVALGLGLLSSPTFAHGTVVDPDPAGIGTYLVSALLLALGIAIFLYHLIGEARANRPPLKLEAREQPAQLDRGQHLATLNLDRQAAVPRRSARLKRTRG